jgi:hypothetical protein
MCRRLNYRDGALAVQEALEDKAVDGTEKVSSSVPAA